MEGVRIASVIKRTKREKGWITMGGDGGYSLEQSSNRRGDWRQPPDAQQKEKGMTQFVLEPRMCLLSPFRHDPYDC